MSKILAYIRVSTIHQNPDNQKLEIERYAAIRGLEVTDWIVLSVSTRKSELTRRINELKTSLTNGDVLITTELSRLGRSLGQVISLIDHLAKHGVVLHVIKQNLILGSTPDLAAKIQLTVFALLAEIERDIISERVKMGLQAAKQKGKALGRPLGSTGYKKLQGKEVHIKELLGFGVSKRAIARMYTVSPNTVCNFIKEW